MRPHADFKRNLKCLKLSRGDFKLGKMVFFTFFDNFLEYFALLWPEIDKDCFVHTASRKDKTRINHNAKFQRFSDWFRLSRRISNWKKCYFSIFFDIFSSILLFCYRKSTRIYFCIQPVGKTRPKLTTMINHHKFLD